LAPEVLLYLAITLHWLPQTCCSVAAQWHFALQIWSFRLLLSHLSDISPSQQSLF